MAGLLGCSDATTARIPGRRTDAVIGANDREAGFPGCTARAWRARHGGVSAYKGIGSLTENLDIRQMSG